jgi:CheY-like chemotaxis protein
MMDVVAVSPAYELVSSANCRVLVVEDDAICQDTMLLMLGRLGYHAAIANDGVDALTAMHAAHYDLVLMDIQMPRMDGIEAARLIRTELDPADQPAIVAMTADTTPQCREECIHAGMDGHLGKPVHMADLSAALEGRFVRHGKIEAVDPGDSDDGGPPGEPVTVVYDPAVLDSLLAELDVDGSVRTDLIESFILDCEERSTALIAAGDAADLGALAFEAHAIKSASATMGLLALSEVAREIVVASRATASEVDIGSQALRLACECENAIGALKAALLTERG